LKFDSVKYDGENNLLCYLYLQNKTFLNAHLIKNDLADVDTTLAYQYKSKFKEIFRYDYHPEIGNLMTHPLYHLHVGCWHTGGEKFSGTPRFRVPEVMLEEVLALIIRDFLT